MSACDPNRCHGWSAVCCAACGVVAPCARADCPSCGKHPELLREAKARRARKVKWKATEGLKTTLPLLPAAT